jgi:hypothetical protein
VNCEFEFERGSIEEATSVDLMGRPSLFPMKSSIDNKDLLDPPSARDSRNASSAGRIGQLARSLTAGTGLDVA